MTAMITNVQTKKQLLVLVRDGHASSVRVSDPSFFAPFEGTLARYMADKTHAPFVLDHPKRTKFAAVDVDATGKLVAS